MATNFPDTSINNPNTGVGWANGDAFDDTAESGLIYYWYDPVWKTNISAADADDKYVEVDGDNMTGDLTVPSLNGGPLAGFRNLLINGDLRIWQRGVDFSVASSPRYTADRWRTGADRAVKRVSFNNKFGAEIDGGTNSPILGQPIEIDVAGRPGPFVEGNTYTFSCFIKTSVSTDIELHIQHRVSTDDNTGAQDVVPLTTIETGVQSPQTISHTFTYLSSMRPTSDKTCTYVEVRTTAGSGTMTITDVQLEPGPVATPFEHRPYGTELALCQRYYDRVIEDPSNSAFLVGTQTSGGSMRGTYFSSVEMRVTPTVINGTGLVVTGDGNEGTDATLVATSKAGTAISMSSAYTSLGITNKNLVAIRAKNTNELALDAEL